MRPASRLLTATTVLLSFCPSSSTSCSPAAFNLAPTIRSDGSLLSSARMERFSLSRLLPMSIPTARFQMTSLPRAWQLLEKKTKSPSSPAEDLAGKRIGAPEVGDSMRRVVQEVGVFIPLCLTIPVVIAVLVGLVPIIFSVALGLRFVNCVFLRNCPEAFTLNLAACNQFEDRWVADTENSFPASTRSEWVDLPGGIRVHHIVVPRTADSFPRREKPDATSPDMVMLHGAGSAAALAWASCAGSLSSNFTLYAPDLPAFGRSPLQWEIFRTASHSEVEDLYADFIANYIDSMALSKPIVVAHSIGGFFASKFAKKYPNHVSKLILVDPAGMLPTLGDEGNYFGLLFKLGIPTRQLRSMGQIASLLLYSIFDFQKAGAKAYFWLQLNASPNAFGDHVAAKFITFSAAGLRVHWNRPALLDILTAGVPVAFIYGENDNLMPPRQGRLVQRLMSGDDTTNVVGIIPGAWHMPFHINKGRDFVEEVLRATELARVPVPSERLVSNLESLDPSAFSSSWNLKVTSETVRALYADLLALS